MLQALYIGELVACGEGDAVYIPETVEDLAIVRDAGSDDERIELVQVKSKQNAALALSHLKPKKHDTPIANDDSFLGHVWSFWSKGIPVSAKVVAFGEVGPELSNAAEGLKEGGPLWRKLVDGHGYSAAFCTWLATNIAVERADEEGLRSSLRSSLGTRAETAAAVDLAMSDVEAYIYECCRTRERITPEIWRGKLADFGVQAASARGYLANYGQTVVPLAEYLSKTSIEEADKLKRSYMAGAAAVPQHIAMGLDIERPRWQEEIGRAFGASQVVVVRGASGQGKSTVCYRWLMDVCAISDVYLISGVTSDNFAGIASALRGLAKFGNGCVGYVEADSDDGWVGLCAEINRISASGLKLLVSVREDDAARAGYSAESAGARDVYLRFGEGEARGLYEQSGTSLFPTFEFAWQCFGGGPLLEFAYSLNHKVGLRGMLKGQVEKIRSSGEKGWLEFLYLASAAGEYGLPSSIQGLVDVSGCENPQRMLGVMEDELLLRSDSERGVVLPLHPYRSKLLEQIIAPMLYEPEEDLTLSACGCACGDYGPLLVRYLHEHELSDGGMASLTAIAGRSWSSAVHALRAMVWKDARVFFLSTEHLLKQVREHGYPMTSAGQLAIGATDHPNPEYLDAALALIKDEAARENLKRLILLLGEYTTDFYWTDRFLSGLVRKLPLVLTSKGRLHDAGFVLAYLGQRGFSENIPDEVVGQLADLDLERADLEGALDFLVGLNCAGITVKERNRVALLSRVCQRDHVVWLNTGELIERHSWAEEIEPYDAIPACCLDEGGEVKQLSAIVVPDLDDDEKGARDMTPNDIVMRAICDLRRIYPDRGGYCARYVGLKALCGGLEIPDCEKHIPEKNLRLNWPKLINQYYFAMCGLADEPAEDWTELRISIQETLSDSVAALRQASELVDVIISGNKRIKGKVNALIDITTRTKDRLDTIKVDTPACARDPYGFDTGRQQAIYDFMEQQGEGGIRDGRGWAAPAFGIQRGSSRILPVTASLLMQLQLHFNQIIQMILYIAGRQNRPVQATIYTIAHACALADSAEVEFASVFGPGEPLFRRGQKEALMLHALHWNYVWWHGPNKSRRTLAQQKMRLNALGKAVEKFAGSLRKEPSVMSAVLRGHEVLVEYDIDAGESFAEVAAKCLERSLGYDPNSPDRLFEWCMLRESIDTRIEIYYIQGGRRLLHRSFRLGHLVDHLKDPESVDRLAPGSLLPEPEEFMDSQEALIRLAASAGSYDLMESAVVEVREAIAGVDPGLTHVVVGECSRWTTSIERQLATLREEIERLSELASCHDAIAPMLEERRENSHRLFSLTD